MKIIYISDSYPPVINGLSNVVEHLARCMADKGHQVEVLTLLRSGNSNRLERSDGVIVKRFMGFSPARSYHFPSPQLLRTLKNGADIVHVHNFHSVMPFMYSLFSKDNRRIKKSIITPHYHVPGHYIHSKFAWFFYKPILNRIVKDFDVVHCVSEFEAEQVFQGFGIKSLVVENGIDRDVYDFKWSPTKNSDLTITCISRLEKYKRLDLAVKAASLLQKKGYPVKLNIIGSGPEGSHLIHLAKKNGVNLRLKRVLSRKSLLTLISKSNCVVNPSQYEAYSLVIAEALAIGVPVIIVYPWGVNFRNYPRAFIVKPNTNSIVNGILRSLDASEELIKHVPTWAETANQLFEKAYANSCLA